MIYLLNKFMEIDKINEELHNCKSSQGKINTQLANRKKLIDFFNGLPQLGHFIST